MANGNDEMLGGEGKALGSSGLSNIGESLGRVMGFPSGDQEATQGGHSVGDFDPTSYVVDSLGIMQAAPSPDSSTSGTSGNQADDSASTQDSDQQ